MKILYLLIGLTTSLAYAEDESIEYQFKNTGQIKEKIFVATKLPSGLTVDIPIVNGWVPEVSHYKQGNKLVLVLDYQKKYKYNQKVEYKEPEKAVEEILEKYEKSDGMFRPSEITIAESKRTTSFPRYDH